VVIFFNRSSTSSYLLRSAEAAKVEEVEADDDEDLEPWQNDDGEWDKEIDEDDEGDDEADTQKLAKLAAQVCLMTNVALF